MIVYLDCETNVPPTKVWCVYTYDTESEEYKCHTEPSTLSPLLDRADKIVAHNLIGFDAPILNRLWKTKIGLMKAIDTLILSRLLNPSIEGGHSLDAWGKRLGKKKIDYSRLYWRLQGCRDVPKDNLAHFNDPHTEAMQRYCKRDVEVLVKLHKHLNDDLKDLAFSDQSVELEHRVAAIVQKQVDNGFTFDTEKAQALLAELSGRVADIEGELQEVFPPIVTERYSEKTGKRLKDKVEVFNLASRKQIAERLATIGVEFNESTDKGNVVVNEKVLEGIDKPEAKLLNEYLLIQKRIGLLKGWFEEVQEDGKIHGRINTNGAVTGRMTHFKPNMAQVPSVSSQYGAECRECFSAKEDWVLVGADASGLELRMLAHYMNDEEYTNEILNGDIHTKNQEAAGLPDRPKAKTFIYAFLYGAGDAKIGSIIGGSARKGQAIKERFLSQTPALARLQSDVKEKASKGWIQGLDGRKVWVRSQHAALNTLLQSAGALVMKKALCVLWRDLNRLNIPFGICANVHDEWQIETPAPYANIVGQQAVVAIRTAGVLFKLRCPLDGEYKIGKTWKDTH